MLLMLPDDQVGERAAARTPASAGGSTLASLPTHTPATPALPLSHTHTRVSVHQTAAAAAVRVCLTALACLPAVNQLYNFWVSVVLAVVGQSIGLLAMIYRQIRWVWMCVCGGGGGMRGRRPSTHS